MFWEQHNHRQHQRSGVVATQRCLTCIWVVWCNDINKVIVVEMLECRTFPRAWWLRDKTNLLGSRLHDKINIVDSHCKIRSLWISSIAWKTIGFKKADLQKGNSRSPKYRMECDRKQDRTSLMLSKGGSKVSCPSLWLTKLIMYWPGMSLRTMIQEIARTWCPLAWGMIWHASTPPTVPVIIQVSSRLVTSSLHLRLSELRELLSVIANASDFTVLSAIKSGSGKNIS